MILGFVSFLLFIIDSAIPQFSDQSFYEAIEFSHIAIVFIGLSLIFQGLLLVSFAARAARNYMLSVRSDCRDLLEHMHHSFILDKFEKTVLSRLPGIGSNRLQKIKFRMTEVLFFENHDVTKNFDYARYVGHYFKEYIAEVGDISSFSWMMLAILALVNLGRAGLVDHYIVGHRCLDHHHEHACVEFAARYALLLGGILLVLSVILMAVSAHYMHEVNKRGIDIVLDRQSQSRSSSADEDEVKEIQLQEQEVRKERKLNEKNGLMRALKMLCADLDDADEAEGLLMNDLQQGDHSPRGAGARAGSPGKVRSEKSEDNDSGSGPSTCTQPSKDSSVKAKVSGKYHRSGSLAMPVSSNNAHTADNGMENDIDPSKSTRAIIKSYANDELRVGRFMSQYELLERTTETKIESLHELLERFETDMIEERYRSDFSTASQGAVMWKKVQLRMMDPLGRKGSSSTGVDEIFLFSQPKLYLWWVHFMFLLQNVFIALALTQIVPLIVRSDSEFPAKEQSLYLFGLLMVMVLNFFSLLYVIPDAVLLSCLTQWRTETAARVCREQVEEETILKQVRSTILSRLDPMATVFEKIAFVQEEFSALDKSGKGQIDRETFRRLLREINVILPRPKVEILMRVIDIHLTGSITWDEVFLFLFPSIGRIVHVNLNNVQRIREVLLAGFREEKVPRAQWEASLRELFDKHAAPGAGRLTRVQFQTMLASKRISLPIHHYQVCTRQLRVSTIYCTSYI